MNKQTKSTKKLSHKDFIHCLDIFCRASFAISQTDAQLSQEMLKAIEILTMACSTEQTMTKKEEERINKFCEKYERVEDGTITDLFSGDILYRG